MQVYVEKEIEDLPSTIDGFIEAINKAAEATGVPREAVEIELDTYDEYGSSSARLTLCYHREETPEEAAARKALADHLKQWELDKLAELKAKYEGAAA